MLNLKLAEAYIDLTLKRTRYDAAMRAVLAQLAGLPNAHVISINVNRMQATSNINLLMQQLQALQKMTHLKFTTSGKLGGGGGGFRVPGFGTGLAQGIGLPYAASPAQMAGQAVGGGIMASVRTAMDLETSFAELRRITGATADQMATLKSSIFDISTSQAGVSVGDLTDIAQIGGRMGVVDKGGMAGLATFVQQLALVRNAITDIPTEDLANRMGRVLNVFQHSTDYVAGFGSALTALDNISTAAASDILDITQRLSGTAQAIGLTLPQVMALAATLKDVGLSNEVAGSSFSQIFRKMATDSANFAQQVGVDASTFAAAYRRDPMEALGLVIARFKELDDTISGQQFLESLGLRGVRVTASLQQLASQFDEVSRRAKIASDETGSLNALTAANAVKSATATAEFTKLKNAATELGDALGNVLLPEITPVVQGMTTLTRMMTAGAPGLFQRILQGAYGGMSREDAAAHNADVVTEIQRLMGTAPDQVAQAAPRMPALPAVQPGQPGQPGGAGIGAGPRGRGGAAARDPMAGIIGMISASQGILAQPLATASNAAARGIGIGLLGDMLGRGAGGVLARGGLSALQSAINPKDVADSHYGVALSGQEIGRQLQEAVLNRKDDAARKTAENTTRLTTLVGQLLEAVKQGANRQAAARLGP